MNSSECFSQELLCLSEIDFKENTYWTNSIEIRPGNVVSIDRGLKSSISLEKFEKIYENPLSNETYYFTASSPIKNGWLITDKTKDYMIYFSREWLFMLNKKTEKIVWEKQIICGFDVFSFGNKCGYHDPCLLLKEEKMFFYKKNLIRKKSNLVIMNLSNGSMKKIGRNCKITGFTNGELFYVQNGKPKRKVIN